MPWSKLKYLSDSQAISWDWLLAGIEPKTSAKVAKTPRTTRPSFNRAGINRRYLSLFHGMKQADLADLLNVTPSTVSEWKKNKSQVPWERLHEAVQVFRVRWDWLLDGLDPKYRE